MTSTDETIAADQPSSLGKLGNRLSLLPIHPFLFAALPIIASVAEVKKLVLPEEIMPSITIAEGCALVLLIISSALLRSITNGAIVSSLIIGLFFSYRLLAYALEALIKAISGQPAPDWLVLSLYALLCLGAVSSSMKTKWDFGKLKFELEHTRMNQALNVISLFLLVFNSFTLIQFEVEDESVNQKFVQKFKTAFDQVKVNADGEKPDVYYFIVDGFAARATIREFCHTDDPRLEEFFRAHKFYIPARATSNYDRTEFSVSSTLSMQYIDAIPDNLGKDYDRLNLFCRIIQDSAVLRTFKRLGYTFVNMSSGTSATDFVYTADKNIRCSPFNHFCTAIGLLTPLYATEKYYPFLRNMQADLRLCPGHCMKQLVDIPGPKFVVIHTDLSHAPCLFGEHGEPLALPPGQFMVDWGTPKQLSDQWKFGQSVLIQWLTEIFDLTHGKAVVIVQSDHGSGIPFPKQEDWFNERMRILSAIYFPGKNDAGLYPTITPVNSFRVLFDDYFQAKLPMLPDKAWCAPVYTKPFEWIDVREKIHFDEAK